MSVEVREMTHIRHRVLVTADQDMQVKLICECGWNVVVGYTPMPAALVGLSMLHAEGAEVS